MPRLHILSDTEADLFDQPPSFHAVQRKKYFYVSGAMNELLQSLRKPWTQVGFLLQWGCEKEKVNLIYRASGAENFEFFALKGHYDK